MGVERASSSSEWGGIAGGMLTFLQLFFVVVGGAFVYQNLAMFKFRM
jgi:hypothetical protein